MTPEQPKPPTQQPSAICGLVSITKGQQRQIERDGWEECEHGTNFRYKCPDCANADTSPSPETVAAWEDVKDPDKWLAEVRGVDPGIPQDPIRLTRPLPANGEADCPQCHAMKSVRRHNADWNCHLCGFCEVVDSEREPTTVDAVEWTKTKLFQAKLDIWALHMEDALTLAARCREGEALVERFKANNRYQRGYHDGEQSIRAQLAAAQTGDVKCIGRGTGDGCGHDEGVSGGTCPSCGGMLLSLSARHSAACSALQETAAQLAAAQARVKVLETANAERRRMQDHLECHQCED